VKYGGSILHHSSEQEQKAEELRQRRVDAEEQVSSKLCDAGRGGLDVEVVMAIGHRVLAGLSFAIVASVLISQQPQNQNGEITTLRQTKQPVIVDVVVGDRYGTAVPGLKQEDFTILEDGKPQPITFFEAHGGHR
jgi:hypothetical protein